MLDVAIFGNVAMAVAKFIAAAATGSSARLSEGVHILVDTGNELLLPCAARSSQRVVDGWHSFGYGKTTDVWSLIVVLSVFSVRGGTSVHEGIISPSGAPVLADPWWNCPVLAIAAAFQGYRWRMSQKELDSHRHPGESLWHAAQRARVRRQPALTGLFPTAPTSAPAAPNVDVEQGAHQKAAT